jgi:hypothetical protein
MEAAGEAGHEAAPAPFRKRDQFPDITTESVNMRLKQDYYPADRGRFPRTETFLVLERGSW